MKLIKRIKRIIQGQKPTGVTYAIYEGNYRNDKNAKRIMAIDNLDEALTKVEELKHKNKKDYYAREEAI